MSNNFFDVLDQYDIHRASLRPPCSPDLRARLYQQQDGRCNNPPCNERKPIHDLECGYVVPLHAGGADHPDNIQLLCGACKALKGAGTMQDLAAAWETRQKRASRASRIRHIIATALPFVVIIGSAVVALAVAFILVGVM